MKKLFFSLHDFSIPPLHCSHRWPQPLGTHPFTTLSLSSSLNVAALPKNNLPFLLSFARLSLACRKLTLSRITKAVEMQQPGPMFPVTPSFPSTNITTEQIQKYLDENKKLILAILDNQNLGKLAECAQYQAQLQKNLMYLAAIADAQPQTTPSPSMPPPMTPHNAMQQGGLYIPHPQAAAMSQQPGAFAQRAPFSIPHPMQDPRYQLPQQLHPQSTQGLMAMWPVGATNGMNPMHNNVNLGGVNNILPALNAANKQGKPESGATPKSDGQGASTIARGSADEDKAK